MSHRTFATIYCLGVGVAFGFLVSAALRMAGF